MSNVANESLSVLRSVQSFNGKEWGERKFADNVNDVLELGRKEARASAVFFGKLSV